MIGHTNYWVQYLTPPQQQNMPVGVKSMTIKHGYDGRGNAAILQLGIDACAATAAVHAAPPAERAGLLARALDLRTRELEAWTAFRTPEMPDGDKVGMSMAANGLANVHMLRHQFDPFDPANSLDHARGWLARADAFLEGEDSTEAVTQRDTVRANGLQLELFAATRFLHQEVRVHGLANAQHYNGRLGFVMRVVEPARYQVRLHAAGDAPEATLLVHERKLMRV
jgi:hypothetical protein